MTSEKNDSLDLLKACEEGNLDDVVLLLSRGVDVNTRDEDGFTPLFWASVKGHSDIVKILLTKDAGVDARDKYGSTPLMKASNEGFFDIVETLINYGADVKAKNKKGFNALYKAVGMGNTRTVALLIAHGAVFDTAPKVTGDPHATEWMSAHKEKQILYQQNKLEKEYELKDEIGRGGFGVVYHVKNKLDEGEFALKIIKLPKQKSQQEKVKSEVTALLNLDHPRIIRYHTSWSETVKNTTVLTALGSLSNPDIACGELSAYDMAGDDVVLSDDPHSDDEAGYWEQKCPTCLHIQIQLCSKDTLKEWLEKNKHNRLRKKVLELFEQVLDAVRYIHSRGFLHRDLKPSNVFFSREDGSVKVGDFGLVAGMNTEVDTIKHGGKQKQSYSGLVGTQFYMAPEQMAGRRYDKKVDIFALGVIFFELNCPFSTPEQRVQVLTGLMKSGRKLPSTFAKLPHEAELIVLLLASDPDKRPLADQVSEGEHLKALRESIKKPGTAIIPNLPNSTDIASETLPGVDPEADDLLISRDESGIIMASHTLTESEYPGLYFLHGKHPWRTSVTSHGGIVSWDDIGIQFNIPAGAIPEWRELPLIVRPCLGGRFILPNGCLLASPVFIITPEFKFKTEVTVCMVHFMDLRSQDECERMVFISAQPTPRGKEGKPEYHFKVFKKGAFHTGQNDGSICLDHFCALAIATEHSHSGISGVKRKRGEGPDAKYSLQLYMSTHKALVSASLCHPIYDMNLRNQHPTFVPLSDAKLVRFSHDAVSLQIPSTSISGGWMIVPKQIPCEILRDAVDLPLSHPTCADLTYPPKMLLTFVEPQKTPRIQTKFCELTVRGFTKQFSFNIPLKSTAGAQSTMISAGTDTAITPTIREVTDYLLVLDKKDIYNLGFVLGLSHDRVKYLRDSETFLDEVINAWLLGVDQVTEQGAPSWTNLVKALQHKRLGHNGIAKNIAMDKKLVIK